MFFRQIIVLFLTCEVVKNAVPRNYCIVFSPRGASNMTFRLIIRLFLNSRRDTNVFSTSDCLVFEFRDASQIFYDESLVCF